MNRPMRSIRRVLTALALVLASTAAWAQLSPQEAAAQYDFDLSGVEITTTSSLAGALLMPQAYMIEMLEAWGADVEIVTLTNTSGVQALIARRSDLAPHGADELIIGAAEGAQLVAYGSPQSKINYVLVGTDDIDSVADLVSTERACAWTLGGILDEEQFARLAAESETALAPFRDHAGAVRFTMPVLVIRAEKPV